MRNLITFCPLLLVLIAAEPTTSPSLETKWILRLGSPAELEQIIKEQPERRERRMKFLKGKIRDLDAQLKIEIRTPRKSNEDAKTRKAKIDSIRAELTEVRFELKDVTENRVIAIDATLMPIDVKVGHAGMIDIRGATAFQVIDKENSIVSLSHFEGQDTLFWLTGVDTSNFVDRKPIDFNGTRLLYASATTTYGTVSGGTRTLIKLIPFERSMFVRVPVDVDK